MECTGLPKDEDINCSDKLGHDYTWDDHHVYLQHNVTGYGENGCVDP